MNELISNYKILENFNLVIEYHSGIITAQNYIAFKKQFFSDPFFKPNLNHLIHFKNVKFNTTPTDISEFVAFMKENLQSLGNRKVAFVTNTPNQVVSTTIYKLMQNDKSQVAEIFSTNESALYWLNIPKNAINDIIKTIKQLKKLN
jgi:mevalonate kinase